MPGRIDDEESGVGAVDRLERAHEAVVLGRLVDAAAATHAGGVDEAQRPVLGLDHRVDRVACGAGLVVHDGALVADEAVEQRGLPDIGTTHDRDRERTCVRLGLDLGRHCRRQHGHDRVEQVTAAPPVQRRHDVGIAQAELRERPGIALAGAVVDLVDDDDRRRPGAAQERRDACVLLGDADCHVDDEDDHVGLGDGSFRLPAHLLIEVAAAGEPAARVDHPEMTARPLGDELLAVAGDARLRLDDGLPPTGDAVHERRLAHVRPADDRDHRKLPRHRRAATSDAPSVGTTSTGRGRSATAMPSRKRSRDSTTSGRR